MIYIALIAALLQGCFAAPFAIESNCANPLEIVRYFDVLQQWSRGTIARFTFDNAGILGDRWAVLIKFNRPILKSGGSVVSWLQTRDDINDDGDEILFRNIHPVAQEEVFSLLVSFTGEDYNQLESLIDRAMVFDVQDGICFDIEYEENNILFAKDVSMLDSEGSGSGAGKEEEEIEEDNCIYMRDAVTTESHMWRDGKLFNFKGTINLEVALKKWTVKLVLGAPLAGLQTWVADSTREEAKEGNLWYITPKPYNVEQRKGLSFQFIATVADNTVPTALVFLCNNGEEPSPSVNIPQDAEDDQELLMSLAEVIASNHEEETTTDEGKVDKTELIKLFR